MSEVELPPPGTIVPWTFEDFRTACGMWTIMMAAMMLPTAAPWVLNLSRAWRPPDRKQNWILPAIFLSGYLFSWILFSVAAAGFQWLVHVPVAGLSPEYRPLLNGLLLILAGLYQWSGIKDRCLTHCRSPLTFFLTSWKPGLKGGFQMGVHHGLFCVGCCWLLMLMGFVVGVMNLLWMAFLTAYVFIDHVLFRNRWAGKVTGILLVGWGIWSILASSV